MYLFRVVPADDRDMWLCKRGARVIACCDTIVDAVDLAAAEATVHRPSRVVYSGHDGTLSVLAEYGPTL